MDAAATRSGLGWLVLAAGLALLQCRTAGASNGLNLIGFGPESGAMAGADVAVARDSSALLTNPAGLARAPARRIDALALVTYAIEVRQRDAFGNDVGPYEVPITFGSVGAAVPWSNGCGAGAGLFAQGGGGIDYRNMRTAFGTTDDFTAMFGVARLAAGIGCRIGSRVDFGASLHANYARLDQRVFPDTSDAGSGFFGLDADGLEGWAPGGKVGVMLHHSDTLTFGAAYSAPVHLVMKGDSLIVNMTDAGLGRVRYGDVESHGVNLPHEIAVGAAWRRDRWLWSAKLAWLDWSKSVRRATLAASGPDNPAAPPQVTIAQTLDWKDQYVIALGGEWNAGGGTHWRFGWNHGRTPVRNAHITPQLAPIRENHVTGAWVHDLDPRWTVAAGFEYGLRREVTYTNAELPFGPDTRQSNEVFTLMLGASLRW